MIEKAVFGRWFAALSGLVRRRAAGVARGTTARSSETQDGATASGPGLISAEGPVTQPRTSRAPAAGIEQASLDSAVNANNAFAVELLKRVAAPANDANVLVSPLSAQLALTMAYAGAQGATRTEMATALRFAAPDQAIFEGQNALLQALLTRAPDALAAAERYSFSESAPPPSDFRLQVVSSVWGEASYRWEAPYLRALAEHYGAAVHEQDFKRDAEGARQRINTWVSAQTNATIRDLIPTGRLDGATRLVLVNALHLKLPWATPFVPSETRSLPFKRTDGSTVLAPFMRQTANFPYSDDGHAQLVGLPLSGEQLSVLIVLPRPGVALQSYRESLEAGARALRQPTAEAFVELAVPKLTFTSESFSIAEALRELGMQRAFTEHADFGGMCAHPPDDPPLNIDGVLQKTFVSMQEPGVEAAAATAVAVYGQAVSAEPPVAPLKMTVDRPYLLAIVDVPTGAILLVGQVVDPSVAPS